MRSPTALIAWPDQRSRKSRSRSGLRRPAATGRGPGSAGRKAWSSRGGFTPPPCRVPHARASRSAAGGTGAVRDLAWPVKIAKRLDPVHRVAAVHGVQPFPSRRRLLLVTVAAYGGESRSGELFAAVPGRRPLPGRGPAGLEPGRPGREHPGDRGAQGHEKVSIRSRSEAARIDLAPVCAFVPERRAQNVTEG